MSKTDTGISGNKYQGEETSRIRKFFPCFIQNSPCFPYSPYFHTKKKENTEFPLFMSYFDEKFLVEIIFSFQAIELISRVYTFISPSLSSFQHGDTMQKFQTYLIHNKFFLNPSFNLKQRYVLSCALVWKQKSQTNPLEAFSIKEPTSSFIFASAFTRSD